MLTKRDVFTTAVFATLALVLGTNYLPRYDLGWHLAGGLWMLENLRVPQQDPLGAEGSFWWCYSWLFELLVASTYRFGGFLSLQLLQTLVVVLFVCTALWVVASLAELSAKRSPRQGLVAELPAAVLLTLFTSPIWYLRPQLLSVLFFAVLLCAAERRRLRPLPLFLLTIVWVNTHLYWILVPMLLLWYYALSWVSRSKYLSGREVFGSLLLLFAASLLNPYGFEHYSGLYTYVADHKTAYQTILEFQSLSPKQHYLFYLFVLVLLYSVYRTRLLLQRQHLALTGVYAVTAAAAVLRIKFLPLFGISAAVLWARVLGPALSSGFEQDAEQASEQTASARSIVAISGLLLLVLALLHLQQNPLNAEQEELLRAAARTVESQDPLKEGPTIVFNRFDDGGWLAFGFYEARKSGSSESSFKTAIDGRSLVMGDTRLAEYQQITSAEGNWCATLTRWNVELAILPNGSRGSQRLLHEYHESGCDGRWEMVEQLSHWSILELHQ